MIHNVFNEDLLTRYREPCFQEQHMNPVLSTTIINKKEEYKIEEVRKHRKWEWRTQYLVYWKGYGNEHDQWIMGMGLPYVREAIKDYWLKVSS